MEKETIYALIEMSKTSEQQAPFDASINAAFRSRRQRKLHELAQLTFYGSFEMALFTSIDPKNSEESIFSLQQRLSEQIIPHDIPDKQTFLPLLEIMQENACGRSVAWYRYLWCDCLAAAVFEQCKQQFQKQLEGGSQSFRHTFRELLLARGANIDIAAIADEFCLNDDDSNGFLCSPEALFRRYRC